MTKLKKKVKKIIKKILGYNKPIGNLPQIKVTKLAKTNKKIFHVSAFNYGNAGDALLPLALQDLWKEVDNKIKWKNQLVYPTVNLNLIKQINKTSGIVIGGGGLFLKDTNANNHSGWQWPCSIEMLSNINVPVALFAVGYNRFRGQDEFEPVFKKNIVAFAKKAVYLGLRNHGSINAVKSYLPENLHSKLRFQPCMTTFLRQIYKNDINFNKKKENFIVINAAFDRSHLRFGENIGDTLSSIARVLKVLSQHYSIKVYSHMLADEAIIPFLQSYKVDFDLVRLSDQHPKKIIEEYIKPKLVIGMRGHAQMIPFGCSTPILSIVSHNKMQWFLDDIGKPEWGVDVLNSNFEKELHEKALQSLENTNDRIDFIENKQNELYKLSLNNIEEGLTAIRNHS
ncbi:polysaccharide pyruvyl transferase family protein [Algibacter sp. PT7-4]|uniref:polysaccharide pyruvyl transferase family protein n=1 Tax=Algibacter ulvanivorans TaxID=3400999 RepID=UPI003AACA2D2